MSERLERLSEMDSAVTEGIKLMSFTKTLSGRDAADIRDQIAELRRVCAETDKESAALREELDRTKTEGAGTYTPALYAVCAGALIGLLGSIVAACYF